MNAQKAVSSRVDVVGAGGRSWKNGIFTFAPAEHFRKDFKFDSIHLEVGELSIFIPIEVIPLLSEMIKTQSTQHEDEPCSCAKQFARPGKHHRHGCPMRDST